MNAMTKWIGGGTAAVALLIGAALIAGHVLEPEPADPQGWLAADDVVNIAMEEAVTEPEPEQELTAADAAIEAPFVIKSILPIDGPIKYGEWHWNEDRAPAEGPLVMTVDLDARVISVFRDGHEIGAAAVLLGTDTHPTPLGVFPILEKKRHNISSIYGASMPYTMRLTWDGVAIHSSQVENGYASHGCIGTPDEFAAKLFAIARNGDKVIVTRGQKAGIGTPLTV